jgi:hypothetical protein
MARALTVPGANTQPRDALEYLPVRAQCPDNRLRMVNVAHRWTEGAYAPATDACGRTPARAPNYKGFRDVAGFYANGHFYPRQED